MALDLRVFIATDVKMASSAWLATGSVHGTKLAVRTAGVNMTAIVSVTSGTREIRVFNAIPPTSDRIALRLAIRKTLVAV